MTGERQEHVVEVAPGADLYTLGIADGVTLLPLRPDDSADRIINDVLPMLGLDPARLAA